jgi:hypothetical protein
LANLQEASKTHAKEADKFKEDQVDLAKTHVAEITSPVTDAEKDEASRRAQLVIEEEKNRRGPVSISILLGHGTERPSTERSLQEEFAAKISRDTGIDEAFVHEIFEKIGHVREADLFW